MDQIRYAGDLNQSDSANLGHAYPETDPELDINESGEENLVTCITMHGVDQEQ